MLILFIIFVIASFIGRRFYNEKDTAIAIGILFSSVICTAINTVYHYQGSKNDKYIVNYDTIPNCDLDYNNELFKTSTDDKHYYFNSIDSVGCIRANNNASFIVNKTVTPQRSVLWILPFDFKHQRILYCNSTIYTKVKDKIEGDK